MTKLGSTPPVINRNPKSNLPESQAFNNPAPQASDTPSLAAASLYEPVNILLNTVDAGSGAIATIYNNVSTIKDGIESLNDARNQLGQPMAARFLVWEGPLPISGWPTDVGAAIKATNTIEAGLKSIGKTLDPSLKDKVTYVDDSGTRIILDKKSAYAVRPPEVYDRAKTIGWDPGHNYDTWTDATVIAVNWGVPSYAYFPNGKLYRIDRGRDGVAYGAEVNEFISDSSRLSLCLYGDQFLAETQRLKNAGLPVAQYDGYQYTIGGKIGYTPVNQILTRSSPDFSGVADGTIVAVGTANRTDYYLVNDGRGQILDGPPKGVSMGLPANAKPQGDVRYTNSIVGTLDLVQGGTALAPGDYDMGKYSFGGGQVGYAKLPPVVVTTNPETSNTMSYPPGTLLQYTDGNNNVSYYRVTGTGVAKVEDASTIAKTVTGNPPDLSSVDAGTLVKLDDGKLYWVTKDKKTLPADGAPIMRFMSPEQAAKWVGVQATEALQKAGVDLADADYDACRYLDVNNNTVYAKLPVKVFDGPGTEPFGKDYAPGDVVQSSEGSRLWYIDDQGKAQVARPCIKLKDDNVSKADFDPSKYDPGDVVGTDDGYYRITSDHGTVRISYPLEKLLLNPSDKQISAIKSKIIDLQNAKSSKISALTNKLQLLMSDRSILFTFIASLLSALDSNAKNFVRNTIA